jgi:hypothetical protein
MSYVYNRTRTAQAAIAPYRFVKPGTINYTAVQASAPTDSIIGVSLEFYHPQAGERFDFAIAGPAQIEVGANPVADGDLLTSDANGMAVTVTRHAHTENLAAAYTENAITAPAASVRVGALALMAGQPGDIIDVYVQPMPA